MTTGPDTIVLMLGKDLAVGDQLSGQECPYCARRGYSEKSMSISRDYRAVIYQCHRASCGARGYVRAEGAEGAAPRAKSESRWAAYLRYASPIMEEEKKWLASEWNMEARHFRRGMFEYSPAVKRLVCPIFNSEGVEIGASLRAMATDVTPKSMIVMTKDDELCMSFYKGTENTDVCIVVEDQASAIRASMYCNAVALLGVYVDSERAREIAKTKAKRVIWCLDKDAFKNTIKISTKYGYIFKRSEAVCPPKDLKDMTEQELKEFLQTECNIPIEKEETA